MLLSFSFSLGSTHIDFNEVVTLHFDGGSGPIIKQIPANNSGLTIMTITATTASGRPYNTPIEFSGDEAASFSLTNGGVCPCELVAGGTDLVPGDHIGRLTFEATVP